MPLLWVSKHGESASSSEMVCLIGWVFKQIPELRPLPHCGVNCMVKLMKQPLPVYLWVLPLCSDAIFCHLTLSLSLSLSLSLLLSLCVVHVSLCVCVCVCVFMLFSRFRANRSLQTVWSRGRRRNAWKWLPQTIPGTIQTLVDFLSLRVFV